jgi:hypothetical protein
MGVRIFPRIFPYLSLSPSLAWRDDSDPDPDGFSLGYFRNSCSRASGAPKSHENVRP